MSPVKEDVVVEAVSSESLLQAAKPVSANTVRARPNSRMDDLVVVIVHKS